MNARIYRNVDIPKPNSTVRILDFMLLFFLFGTQTAYRKRLESTRIKSNLSAVNIPHFRSFIQSLLVEWAGECPGSLLSALCPQGGSTC